MSTKEPTITIIIGVLLIFIGIFSRVLTGTSSITALIPAFWGAPIAVLGLLALAPGRTKVSMGIAALLALLGILGTASVLINLVALFTSGLPSGSPVALAARTAMFVLCGVLLIVSGRYLLRARPNDDGGSAG